MQLQIRFVKARVGRSTGLRCNVNSETMSFKFFKKKKIQLLIIFWLYIALAFTLAFISTCIYWYLLKSIPTSRSKGKNVIKNKVELIFSSQTCNYTISWRIVLKVYKMFHCYFTKYFTGVLRFHIYIFLTHQKYFWSKGR